jgi:hypothetical protein
MFLTKFKQVVEEKASAVVESAKSAGVPEEERTQRLLICTDCDRLLKATYTCKECGCFMKAKTYLKNARCPLGKW